MRYSNIIYDFDGTLSDTYPCFTEAFIETLHHFGLDDSYDNVYSLLKINVGHCIAHYFSDPDEKKEVSAFFHSVHYRIAPMKQKPMEGAVDLLEYVKAHGGRNFIFSHSGAIVSTMLKVWGIENLFDGILDSTVPLERKPSPHGCYYLMGKYEMRKADTIIIGDRDIDTDSGKNAGIRGCLFDPEHYYDRTDVDFRVLRLVDIIDIIK